MVTEKELQEAIDELEAAPSSFGTCERLAVLYTLKAYLNREYNPFAVSVPPLPTAPLKTDKIHAEGSSQFLKAVEGKRWEDVLPVVDELLTAVKVYQPQLYGAFLRRL